MMTGIANQGLIPSQMLSRSPYQASAGRAPGALAAADVQYQTVPRDDDAVQRTTVASDIPPDCAAAALPARRRALRV